MCIVRAEYVNYMLNPNKPQVIDSGILKSVCVNNVLTIITITLIIWYQEDSGHAHRVHAGKQVDR